MIKFNTNQIQELWAALKAVHDSESFYSKIDKIEKLEKEIFILQKLGDF